MFGLVLDSFSSSRGKRMVVFVAILLAIITCVNLVSAFQDTDWSPSANAQVLCPTPNHYFWYTPTTGGPSYVVMTAYYQNDSPNSISWDLPNVYPLGPIQLSAIGHDVLAPTGTLVLPAEPYWYGNYNGNGIEVNGNAYLKFCSYALFYNNNFYSTELPLGTGPTLANPPDTICVTSTNPANYLTVDSGGFPYFKRTDEYGNCVQQYCAISGLSVPQEPISSLTIDNVIGGPGCIIAYFQAVPTQSALKTYCNAVNGGFTGSKCCYFPQLSSYSCAGNTGKSAFCPPSSLPGIPSNPLLKPYTYSDANPPGTGCCFMENYVPNASIVGYALGNPAYNNYYCSNGQLYYWDNANPGTLPTAITTLTAPFTQTNTFSAASAGLFTPDKVGYTYPSIPSWFIGNRATRDEFKQACTDAVGASAWMGNTNGIATQDSSGNFVLDKSGNVLGGYCCGDGALTTYSNGSVVTNSADSQSYLCDNNAWLSATSNAFKIQSIANQNYDVASNSVAWYACNPQLTSQTIQGAPTIGSALTLTYTPPAGGSNVFTSLNGPAQTAAVTQTTNRIPADNFASGIGIFDPTTSTIVQGNPPISGGGMVTNPPAGYNTYSSAAKRLICSSRNVSQNVFTECCGEDLHNCNNGNLPDRVRRTGDVVSSIYDFNNGDNQNYALLFGFQLPAPAANTPYQLSLPTYISPSNQINPDTPVTDWSDYHSSNGFLEFFLTYALDATYLNIGLNDTSHSVKIEDYIVNQPEVQHWMHVKIPLSAFDPNNNLDWKNIDRILLFADPNSVSSSLNVYHSQLGSGQIAFRNVFAIDRIFLSDTGDNSDVRYCAALPSKDSSDVWFRDADVDSLRLDASGLFTVGKFICDETPGWGWTGTQCCGNDVAASLGSGVITGLISGTVTISGDTYTITNAQISGSPNAIGGTATAIDASGKKISGTFNGGISINGLAISTSSAITFIYSSGIYSVTLTGGIITSRGVGESYADAQEGCIRGRPVPNDTVMTVVNSPSGIPVVGTTTNHSLLFLDGQSSPSQAPTFYDCNSPDATLNTNLNYPGFSGFNLQPFYKSCSALGDYYCDYDTRWHSVNEGNYGVPVNSTTTRLDNSASKCCPQNWCGLNQSTCVPNQATNYLDLPYNYSNSNPALITRGTGGNVQQRCINGAWVTAVPKWNPTKTEQGYCPNPTDCYHDSTSGCRPDGYSNVSEGDFYCQSGSWTTKTKLLALQMLSLVITQVSPDYSIYCDSYDKVLNEYSYSLASNPNTAQAIILGKQTGTDVFNNPIYECPNLPGTGTPCTNNFCILKYTDNNNVKWTLLGTTLNLPVDTVQYSSYSFLNLLPESTTQQSSHIDFCDSAATASNGGNFYGCNSSTSAAIAAGTANGANIWYNNQTLSIIYSKQATPLTSSPPSVFKWLYAFISNPLGTIKSWLGLTGPTAYDFVKDMSYFNKLYIAQLGSDKIIGFTEKIGGQSVMIINYSVSGIDLCAQPANQSLKLGTLSGNKCNNSVYVTSDPNIISTYWNDLTTRTRLS